MAVSAEHAAAITAVEAGKNSRGRSNNSIGNSNGPPAVQMAGGIVFETGSIRMNEELVEMVGTVVSPNHL
jgi:hypothetical protein